MPRAKPESSGTFKCASCGGTFQKAWSDEEAEAERDERWSPEDIATHAFIAATGGWAIVCDACYSKTLPSRHRPAQDR